MQEGVVLPGVVLRCAAVSRVFQRHKLWEWSLSRSRQLAPRERCEELGGVVGRHSRPVLVLQVVLGTFGRRKGRLALSQKEFADCFLDGRRKEATVASV